MYALGIVIAIAGAIMLITQLVLHVRYYGRFVRYLEVNHHDHWNTIGSPVQFEDEPRYGAIGYAKYFSSRLYAGLGDVELSKLGDQVRGKRKWMFVSLFIIICGVSIATGKVG